MGLSGLPALNATNRISMSDDVQLNFAFVLHLLTLNDVSTSKFMFSVHAQKRIKNVHISVVSWIIWGALGADFTFEALKR